ncbi:alpha/beta fold hydrolase [Skermania sp. ID1734]|uniref:alpha/beta fold hydrolase n=1 Tax=Skermania sp. ID1734 TaxID=2597516 RepID=UPI00117FBE44|nr:alpha/beta hydrolase [Skermania sp. ID1734]TSD94107.1 alpha/beta fold hydrolase [Skermania sp. ID1734]
MVEATEEDVVIRGLRLHTKRRRGGSEPPLVLIHGLGGSLESWAPLLEALPDRDVVMVDCPGAGLSARPRLPIRVPALADYIVDALGELGVEQADVLGYSLGGLVAQEIAHRHRRFVRKLVLVATICGVWVHPPKLSAQRALLSTKRYRDRVAAEREIPLLAGGRTARDPKMLAAILDGREGHPPTRAGYRYQQYAVLGWTSFRWLPALRMPTLVLAGSADPVVRPANARLLASRLPNAQLRAIEGAGHMLLFDETPRAAQIIERFLAD